MSQILEGKIKLTLQEYQQFEKDKLDHLKNHNQTLNAYIHRKKYLQYKMGKDISISLETSPNPFVNIEKSFIIFYHFFFHLIGRNAFSS